MKILNFSKYEHFGFSDIPVLFQKITKHIHNINVMIT